MGFNGGNEWGNDLNKWINTYIADTTRLTSE